MELTMMGDKLVEFFEGVLTKEPLFKDKRVLQATYTPETILHRDEEIKSLANILAPALKLDKPSNVFVYGKTGCGKTLTVRYTTNQITQVAKEREIPLRAIYLNCKLKRVADTEYRLIAQLAREFGKEIPPTGLPTDEIYNIFYRVVDYKKQTIILVLDEIDQLVSKVGDEILYNLTRVNTELKHAQITLVGISNNLVFVDNLDPRVKSSLSEEEVVFPPYNAIQLQHILKKRSKNAFKEGVLSEGVIEKCAAYAAREHGDARRALELLRVAGELAERDQEKVVEITHIDRAEEKIERDRVLDLVQTQPKQVQATLYAILSVYGKTKPTAIFTGDIYDTYHELCKLCGLRPLTQRRVSDVIAELDMFGIINAKVISKGRYGRTREISLAISPSTIPKIKEALKHSLDI